MKFQVSGDFARFARTIVGGGLKSIRIFTELNAPIPTKKLKILQISYYPEIPVEHTILQI